MLVVTSASRSVGGGCFSGKALKEEMMVTQSIDLAIRLKADKLWLGDRQAFTFEGVTWDVWWNGKEASNK